MRERNNPITVKTLGSLYGRLKREYFPQLLERADVPPEDKEIIRGMLQKPWNPYIRRHTSLTEKAKILNEYNMRLHAGWSKNSDMVKVYTHELGGESSRAILSAYGIMKNEVDLKKDMLEPKYCPNCKEPNKPDSRFCVKDGCGHPLTFKVVKEMQEREQQKTKEAEETKAKVDEIYAVSKRFADEFPKLADMESSLKLLKVLTDVSKSGVGSEQLYAWLKPGMNKIENARREKEKDAPASG